MRSSNPKVVHISSLSSQVVPSSSSPRSFQPRGSSISTASPQDGVAPSLGSSPRSQAGVSPSTEGGEEVPTYGRLKSNSFLSRAKHSISRAFSKSGSGPLEREGLPFDWTHGGLVWSVPALMNVGFSQIEFLDTAMSLQKDANTRLAIIDSQRYCVKSVGALDAAGRAAVEAFALISQRCQTCPYLSRLRAVWQVEGIVHLFIDFACGGELSLAIRIHGGGSSRMLRAYAAQMICAVDVLRKQAHQPWRKLFGLRHLLLADGGNLMVSFSLEDSDNIGVVAPPDAHNSSEDAIVGWSIGVCVLELATRHPLRDADACMRDARAFIKSKNPQLPPELVDFLVPLLSDGKRRAVAVQEWRRAAWFSSIDWVRCEAGKMTPLDDGILKHLDAFGDASVPGESNSATTLVPGATLDIDARTFILPARSTAFRGDTLNL